MPARQRDGKEILAVLDSQDKIVGERYYIDMHIHNSNKIKYNKGYRFSISFIVLV